MSNSIYKILDTPLTITQKKEKGYKNQRSHRTEVKEQIITYVIPKTIRLLRDKEHMGFKHICTETFQLYP